jgi:hypothetical protein
MKIKSILTAAGFAWCGALFAAPLSVSTAVQSQPDPASPVLVVLSAGSEAPAPSANAGPAPAGWLAVDVPGPFTGYVRNKDLSKQLDVVEGATIYTEPKEGAGVLAVFQKGDKVEITGLRGGWTQVRLDKTLVGFISANQAAPVAPAAAPVPAPPTAPISTVSPAPPAPAAPATAAPAQPAGNLRLSQLFEGTLTSSQSPLAPRRPFDWQLVDASGKRIAYVDLSGLLLTDQIENYAGHAIVVLGSIKPVKKTDDIVIEVEALHLK